MGEYKEKVETNKKKNTKKEYFTPLSGMSRGQGVVKRALEYRHVIFILVRELMYRYTQTPQ